MTVTVTPLGSYRNERPYPFCPGCGHSSILDALNQALAVRGTDAAGVVIVSDIGCSGLSDQYFVTSAFHGLHGRSITYASGIKLARPDLDVVVVMGDGGTGIGGAHLINAARRNIGITVLVFNNFNFGMTGGQHSTTTPAGAVTSTTPGGNLERPLDVCGTVSVNGAGYVYRGTSFEEDLPDRIAEAMASGGFALLDIWELCTAYFVRGNKLSRKGIEQLLTDLDFPTGVLVHRELPEYAAAYRQAHAPLLGAASASADPVQPSFTSTLEGRFTIVVAGSAGGRVRSAVRAAARAAVLAGLWAAQRDDYPVTVKSGHSLSTLVLDRRPIDYSDVGRPDALLIISAEGFAKAGPYLEAMGESGIVLGIPDVGPLETRAEVRTFDPAAAERSLARTDLALAGVAALAARLEIFPMEALLEAVAAGPGKPDRDREIIRAGAGLAGAG